MSRPSPSTQPHRTITLLASHTNYVKGKSFERDNRNKGIEKDFSKVSSTTKCYKCQGYGHIVVNCPSPVKFAIIDGATIEAPESISEDFTYQVDEEVGDDFDNNHEGEYVFSCIR